MMTESSSEQLLMLRTLVTCTIDTTVTMVTPHQLATEIEVA